MKAYKAAITHGLDGRLVEPDWPPLTLNELQVLLDQYSFLGNPLELLSVSPRPLSAAAVVATDRAPIFVKRHHSLVRNQEALGEEHRFMAHLRSNGIAVPRVFALDIGETAIQFGEWIYEIHEVAQGVDLYKDAISWTPFRSVNDAHAAGLALARFHEAAGGYDAPPRRNRQLVAGFTVFSSPRPGEELDRYVESRPALREYLHTRTCRDEAFALLLPFHAQLTPLLPSLAPLWTHND